MRGRRTNAKAGRVSIPVIGAITEVTRPPVWPECFGEFDGCQFRFCGDFYEACSAMGSGASTVAVLQCNEDQAASYPATILRFLIDTRPQYVTLADEVLLACRSVFDYYDVVFDVREDGLRRLISVRGRPAESLTYQLDQQHGLLVVRG